MVVLKGCTTVAIYRLEVIPRTERKVRNMEVHGPGRISHRVPSGEGVEMLAFLE